jgi:hypothetical protein
MPTLLPHEPLPLWALIEWRIRKFIGRFFMYLTKWPACGCVDIQVAPWLDMSRQKDETK